MALTKIILNLLVQFLFLCTGLFNKTQYFPFSPNTENNLKSFTYTFFWLLVLFILTAFFFVIQMSTIFLWNLNKHIAYPTIYYAKNEVSYFLFHFRHSALRIEGRKLKKHTALPLITHSCNFDKIE